MATDLVKRNTAKTVGAYLREHQSQIAAAIPKHMSAGRMASVAVQLIARTPGLAECEIASLCGCIMQAATMGLELEPALGQAYLVPFHDKRRGKVCTLIIGYRGAIDLAHRACGAQVWAYCVHERDTFAISLGMHPDLQHTFPLAGDRGAVVGAYACYRLPDGRTDFEYMSRSELDAIRDRSKASGAGPWQTDPLEMVRKTVIRRLVKRLAMGVDASARAAMARAAEAEQAADAGEPMDAGGMLDGGPPPPADARGAAKRGPKGREAAAPADDTVPRANAGTTALPGV